MGIDLIAGGRSKTKHRTAPKSENVYLKLLVKVCGKMTSKAVELYTRNSTEIYLDTLGMLGRGASSRRLASSAHHLAAVGRPASPFCVPAPKLRETHLCLLLRVSCPVAAVPLPRAPH